MPELQHNFNNLQLYILPSANPPPHLVKLHDKIFEFWRDIWTQEFNTLHFDTAFLIDDFIRQDFIAAICLGSDVIAVHLYSLLAIDSLAARSHRYFSLNYPPIFFERLGNMNVRKVMSMEYLTVNPAWRKAQANIHIGAVMGAMALHLMEQHKLDAVIAPARRDHKVHELAYARGGDCIVENISNHNVSCDLIACRREKILPHPSKEVSALIAKLWTERLEVRATEFSETKHMAA